MCISMCISMYISIYWWAGIGIYWINMLSKESVGEILDGLFQKHIVSVGP